MMKKLMVLVFYFCLTSCIMEVPEKNKIAFVGDSILYGHNGYDFFISDYFDNYSCANFSIPGSDSTSLLWRINNIMEYKPDIVCLMIGINDFGYYDNTCDDYIRNINSFISSLLYYNNNIKVYICSILPLGNNPSYNAKISNIRIQEINSLLNNMANEKSNVVYVELFSYFINAENINNLFLDGLHPNQEGYNIIIRELKKKI